MTKAKKKPSRLAKAMVETAGDMRRAGLMDKATHEKITMRHLGGNEASEPEAITGDQIRALRERANMSQAVFAHYLNVTVGYVSQLERGAKRPTGPALVLLNVIRRKGMDVILGRS
jgi:putative transcriptional regulator